MGYVNRYLLGDSSFSGWREHYAWMRIGERKVIFGTGLPVPDLVNLPLEIPSNMNAITTSSFACLFLWLVIRPAQVHELDCYDDQAALLNVGSDKLVCP